MIKRGTVAGFRWVRRAWAEAVFSAPPGGVGSSAGRCASNTACRASRSAVVCGTMRHGVTVASAHGSWPQSAAGLRQIATDTGCRSDAAGTTRAARSASKDSTKARPTTTPDAAPTASSTAVHNETRQARREALQQLHEELVEELVEALMDGGATPGCLHEALQSLWESGATTRDKIDAAVRSLPNGDAVAKIAAAVSSACFPTGDAEVHWHRLGFVMFRAWKCGRMSDASIWALLPQLLGDDRVPRSAMRTLSQLWLDALSTAQVRTNVDRELGKVVATARDASQWSGEGARQARELLSNRALAVLWFHDIVADKSPFDVAAAEQLLDVVATHTVAGGPFVDAAVMALRRAGGRAVSKSDRTRLEQHVGTLLHRERPGSPPLAKTLSNDELETIGLGTGRYAMFGPFKWLLTAKGVRFHLDLQARQLCTALPLLVKAVQATADYFGPEHPRTQYLYTTMVRMLARFKKRKTQPRWVKPGQRAREQLAARGCKVLSKAEMARAEDTVRGEIPQPDDPIRLPDAVSVQDVRTLDELREAIRVLTSSDVVGLDTEFITPFFTKGRPTLALVSLSSHTHCYLVDCPELSRSTTPDQLLKTFAPLLSSREVQKVGFALDEDMRLLKRMTGGDGNSANRHRNVMDLHVKRQQLFPSAPDSGGLAGLCHAVLGKTMDKHWTMSDWLRRPLLPEQRLYAALDAWVPVALVQEAKKARTLPVKHHDDRRG